MVTIDNYHEQVTPALIQKLPSELKQAHDSFDEMAAYYKADADIKETVDVYINVLNKFLSSQKKQPLSPNPKQEKSSAKRPIATSKTKIQKSDDFKFFYKESRDYYFIKRFLRIIGKVKARHHIGLYVKALQRAIVAKEITKKSKYATQIKKIQDKLCRQYNAMTPDRDVILSIPEAWHQQLLDIISKERVYKSVLLMKRFIGLEGSDDKKRIGTLLKALNLALDKKHVVPTDPYYKYLISIRKNLEERQNGKTIEMDALELNGIQQVVNDHEINALEGCNCRGPISSVDFAKMKFTTLGFQGKWKKFLGDPTPGFTALVYGKPKSGKSTLSAMIAGYLASEKGKVLYVSKEEGKNGILQERLIRVGATDPNLFIEDHIPYDQLKNYEYLILDSVHKLNLDEDQLDKLPKKYPNIKGFIFIMHSTKGGDFRGSQTYAHNVDVLIHVQEGGIATQTGRFAQGNEMKIFN